MTRKIFVYGTLKRGLSNFGFIAAQTFLGTARTVGGYRLFDLGGYPGLVSVEEGGYSVEGEVWQVDPPGLALLDELEDIEGGEYLRESIPLQPPWEDQAIEAYLYPHLTEGLPEVGPCWREPPRQA